jgi:large subunit ribosomal protein L31
MKKGIHPKVNKEAKVIFNGKPVMNIISTMDEISTEIWSGNHPFYTGQEILVDTDNLVEKFNQKLNKAQSTTLSKKVKRQRKVEKRISSMTKPQLTLKDMLSNIK